MSMAEVAHPAPGVGIRESVADETDFVKSA
jgi:hypothetical protein